MSESEFESESEFLHLIFVYFTVASHCALEQIADTEDSQGDLVSQMFHNVHAGSTAIFFLSSDYMAKGPF